MKSSNLSVSPGFDLWYLAKGDISWGCSIMKVGFKHWLYKKDPTSLSINLDVVLGLLQSTWCLIACLSRKALAYSLSRSPGIFSPSWFSSSSIIESLFHGGLKSISTYFSGFLGSGWILILYDPVISLTSLDSISSVKSSKSL